MHAVGTIFIFIYMLKLYAYILKNIFNYMQFADLFPYFLGVISLKFLCVFV